MSFPFFSLTFLNELTFSVHFLVLTSCMTFSYFVFFFLSFFSPQFSVVGFKENILISDLYVCFLSNLLFSFGFRIKMACFPFCFQIKMARSFSSVITCINSALDDMKFQESSMVKKKRHWLRNLKTFVLFARMLGDKNKDGSLRSLLIKIEDIVVSDFKHGFQSLQEEIDEWYIAMSDNTRQSNSLTADEGSKIIEFIWNNLVGIPIFSKALAEAIAVLREHVEFLKIFCRFATRRGVDHWQMKDFLTHTEAVAISASHLCFLCGDDDIDDEEWRKEMQFKISMLVQKIKPIDPHVCEIYSQVISCSKFSRRLDAPSHIQEMVDDSTIVMKNFVDSLLSILWVMLQQDTCHVASLKDHRQVIYEGLRSLRTILKKLQPEDMDEKTRDDIGIMVCDAGILVCSFYHKNVQMGLGLQNLWERINIFLAEAKEKVPQTSTFNPSSINERSFVEFLLQNLMELPGCWVEPIVGSRVQSIKKELLCLKSFLEETVELRYEETELFAFQTRVLEVAYRVEFLIDYLIVGDISDSFSMLFDSVMEDIQSIKTAAWKSSSGKRRDIKVKEVSNTSSHVLLPSSKMASLTTEIVGLQDDARSIMNRLQKGSMQLGVIAIAGMGGLGKTTLAAKVFHDPAVIRHFHVRACCPVSQTLDKRTLLIDILDQIHADKCSELTEDDLAEKLWKHLKGRRYLIFLDDVWTIEAWNSLRASFPDDCNGSRIILTSRNHDVAMLDQEPLFLRDLNKEESLKLLQKKLFPGKDWPPALHELGMQIVENCKGLPLTIVIVAGLLATTDQGGWKEIVDGLSSGAVSSIEQCMSSMELSYRHLPGYLKQCFLYFGAFPEDQEVSVRRLIQLWIAEGFIRKSKLKSLIDAAEDYLKDLIGRSLIMVARRGSMGDVKTCRIHDLLRDFCLRKAKDEHILHVVKGYDELLAFNEPSNLRRLCIHSELEHLKKSKLFCPRARSLLFFPAEKTYSPRKDALKNIFLVHIFKFVRVLDLEEINFGYVFPSEIELLFQLRYLAIRCWVEVIPSWIGNLSMLETFILNPYGTEVSLPDTIWNLQKLKYLYIRYLRDSGCGCRLPSANPDDNSSVLYELDTLNGVVINCGPSIMENQISKFPNIRKLRCILQLPWNGTEAFCNMGVQFDFLRRLESLRIKWRLEDVQFEYSFPANLKKLALSGFHGPWSKISTIGGLPKLEVLKLHNHSFRGETWEMKEGEFPKLRYLKLSRMVNLERWTASDDEFEFPCLEKLILGGCWHLKEMPCCLESTTTLEMIEVRSCSKATRTLVKHIKEEQERMGNSALNILGDFDD